MDVGHPIEGEGLRRGVSRRGLVSAAPGRDHGAALGLIEPYAVGSDAGPYTRANARALRAQGFASWLLEVNCLIVPFLERDEPERTVTRRVFTYEVEHGLGP